MWASPCLLTGQIFKVEIQFDSLNKLRILKLKRLELDKEMFVQRRINHGKINRVTIRRFQQP